MISLAAFLGVTACGNENGDDHAPTGSLVPLRSPGPSVVDIEFPGNNVRFACHGSVGLYVTENKYGKVGSSVFAVPNHPECEPG